MHSAVAVGSLLVVFGGCTQPGFLGSTSDLFILDTGSCASWGILASAQLVVYSEKHVWSKVDTGSSRPPSARHGHSATSLGDGRVLVFGGACEDEDGKIRRFNDVHILDTSAQPLGVFALLLTSSFCCLSQTS
jgi:hypothetical protein